MQRFALSLALLVTFACSTVKAADTTTETTPKEAAPATTKHKSCYKKHRAHCHKATKKAETTEGTGTTTETVK
ncbi:MAG: hypothetical protein C5B53_01665 [Candidatus Melainabacteria bacterium]|nr:MAG: hypothetical protein C5B53_01665 [Candidatus Melainabacteria bacterium]